MHSLTLTKRKDGYSLEIGKAKGFLFSPALPLASSVKEGIGRVSRKLSSLGYSDFAGRELFDVATYTLKKPGKMLRPALVILGARLLGESTADYVDLAAAAELLHTASLVHDDVIDGDTVRRGVPTTHARYGSAAALLSGDALIAKAVSIASGYGPKVVKTVADASLDMCAGELLDYTAQKRRMPMGVRQYLRMARLKNGVFMGTCAAVAAVHKRSRKAGRLYRFGLSLGVAFQIRDDVLELVDSEEASRNGGRANATDASNIVKTFERQFGIGRKSALEKAADLNNYFAERALEFIREEEAKDELARYVDFVRIRKA